MKILKEPLVHFLIIGAFLFLLYGLVNPVQNDNEILIDDNKINELVAKWELQRNRKPNLDELVGMVQQHINREVLYQEALEMNLDHNDEIVKLRLSQKMEFLSDGMAETLQPTEDMLKTYYEENKNNYKALKEALIEDIFFSSDKRKDANLDALKVLRSERFDDKGDQMGLPTTYEKESEQTIARDFGTLFASNLNSLTLNQWTGPIQSAYGFHLVYISEKVSSGYFSFTEAKEFGDKNGNTSLHPLWIITLCP